MTFPEALLRARRARGLSQEELAERLGVSRQAVSKWETGEASPDLSKLTALSGALSLSLDVLCGLREEAAEEAEAAGKPLPRRRRWAAVLLALLLLTAGLAAGFGLGRAAGREEAASAAPTLPVDFTVSGLSFSPNDRGAGLFYSFTPSHIPAGCVCQITFSGPDAPPLVLDAVPAGGVCSGEAAPLLPSVPYDVTVTLSDGESARAVPVAAGLSFSGQSVTYTPA